MRSGVCLRRPMLPATPSAIWPGRRTCLGNLRFKSCATKMCGKPLVCRRKSSSVRSPKSVMPTSSIPAPSACFVHLPALPMMIVFSRGTCAHLQCRSGHWTGGYRSHLLLANVRCNCSKRAWVKPIWSTIAASGICWQPVRYRSPTPKTVTIYLGSISV